MSGNIEIPDYQQWLREVKSRITSARVRLALAAKKQADGRWGDKVIDGLSIGLKGEFPDLKRPLASNLKPCKRFFPFFSNGQQSVDQIPWKRNIQTFTKCGELEETKT
jgi:hypothetical protein